MNVVAHCPKCSRKVGIPESRFGQSVNCPGCGSSFKAPAAPPVEIFSKPTPATSETDPTTEEVVSVRMREPDSETKRTIKLLGLLIGSCILVLGLAIGVITLFSGKSETPATSPTTNRKSDLGEGPPTIVNRRPSNPLDRGLWDSDRNERSAAGELASFVAIGLIVLLFMYLSAILFTGSWIARDANRRGMNGVAWCAFFFAFHLAWKGVSAGMATIVFTSLIVTRSVGVTGGSIAALEIFAWTVGFAYWYSRRPGRLVPCEHCEVPTLRYLAQCPNCGK